MLQLSIMRLLIVFLTFLQPGSGWSDLLTNGDFESVREDGWTYRGQNDGSYGVFSEPTRPGTRSYMLQLNDNDVAGYSSISQKVAIDPGKIYQLSFEVFHEGTALNPGMITHSAFLDGNLIFEHHPNSSTQNPGWYRRQATFRARRPEAEILIRLSGIAQREESTSLIDNVRLVESDETLPAPFLRGKPLQWEQNEGRMAVAIAYVDLEGGFKAGYEPLERHRDFTGEYPPLCYASDGWDPELGNLDTFSELIPKIQPWVELGVVPIIRAETAFSKIAEIGNRQHDTYFREWARQARLWGFPLILQPWAEMDRAPELHSGAFVRAWRRVHDLFEAEDARNVLWFWTPSELSGESRRYYPGHSLVNLIGSDGDDPVQVYQQHLTYSSRLRFAFSGNRSLASPPRWLTTARDEQRTQFPNVLFYSHLDLGFLESRPGQAEAYAKMMAEPHIIHRVAQLTPPLVKAVLSREGDSAVVAIENVGGRNAPPSSKLKVQFWSLDPRGSSWERGRIGRAKWVTLDQGEQRSFKQAWSELDGRKFYVSIDRAADSTFMEEITAPDDVVVFSEVSE